MTQETLEEVAHTNPFTGEAFGEAMVYRRGPVLAADGGTENTDDTPAESTTNSCDRQSSAGGSAPQLAEIDHTPPHGEGVARNRIYERGRSENA